jgi:hypothetical protein
MLTDKDASIKKMNWAQQFLLTADGRRARLRRKLRRAAQPQTVQKIMPKKGPNRFFTALRFAGR